jgi:endo-1,4-beta-xylanase
MQYDAPARLEENLQRFADLGLETAVTEIDVRMVVEGEEPT